MKTLHSFRLYLFVALFLWPGGYVSGQSWQLGLSAGPSFSKISGLHDGVSLPLGWNAALDLLHSGRGHFEWGIEMQLNNIQPIHLPAISFKGGYGASDGVNSFGVGVNVGVCGFVYGWLGYLPGVVGGLYFHYGYFVSDRSQLTISLQPRCYQPIAFMGEEGAYLISVPISVGYSFTF